MYVKTKRSVVAILGELNDPFNTTKPLKMIYKISDKGTMSFDDIGSISDYEKIEFAEFAELVKKYTGLVVCDDFMPTTLRTNDQFSKELSKLEESLNTTLDLHELAKEGFEKELAQSKEIQSVLRKELESVNTEIDSFKETIKSQKETIKGLKETVEKQKDALIDLEKTNKKEIRDKDKTIEGMRDEHAHSVSKLNEAIKSAKEEQSINMLREIETLRERNHTLETAKQALLKKVEAFDKEKAKLNDTINTISDLKNESDEVNEALRDENAQLHEDIVQLRNTAQTTVSVANDNFNKLERLGDARIMQLEAERALDKIEIEQLKAQTDELKEVLSNYHASTGPIAALPEAPVRKAVKTVVPEVSRAALQYSATINDVKVIVREYDSCGSTDDVVIKIIDDNTHTMHFGRIGIVAYIEKV